MDVGGSRRSIISSSQGGSDLDEGQMDLRRGPWTAEEDLTLVDYIGRHGEGRWNSLARCAGLKRTGKSCRLRWLNYLRPDVRRGNITLEEQLLILELHSQWGNRWSKIAQHLPGRTDNDIKNYWRTRVQKHAKQLKCDVNSKQFKDTMRYLWMPRLAERTQAASTSGATAAATATTTTAYGQHPHHLNTLTGSQITPASNTPEEDSSAAAGTTSSDSFTTQISPPVSDFADRSCLRVFDNPSWGYGFGGDSKVGLEESFTGRFNYGSGFPFPSMEESNNEDWMDSGETPASFWNDDSIWALQQL
ncbi:hypothetical protein SAY86_011659 [Trapa natans]|uniref:Uncharacterized protein n=1 Tax=Trapa natans TaxID=22666 RepID=A0AAN7LKK5_TRANT|nr:hypothetical protein SAY86_011659 [Trapa natans]